MDNSLTPPMNMAILCYVCYGSIKSKGRSLRCPLVHDLCHVLSESFEEPLYELSTLEILSGSPEKPIYEPDILDWGITSEKSILCEMFIM